MTLRRLWRAKDDPELIYLLFDVTSIEDAQAFLDAPEADDHATKSGVVSGEYHFVENETAKSTLGFSMELP